MAKTQSVVWFNSYNPYEARYPGLKCVSRETLHLIKALRAGGYKVVVLPDDERPLMYITEKGIRDFLSDPLHVLVLGIPLAIITNLVSSCMYEKLRGSAPSHEVHVAIEIDETGRKIRYDHIGEPISDERFAAMLQVLEKRQSDYATSLAVVPPDPKRPCPIYLEHTGKIIGWGTVKAAESGLIVEDAEIIDEETWARIESGDLSGFSISGIVHKTECSACRKDYIDCDHISGKPYDGKLCMVTIEGIKLAEISVVKDPVNPHARVQKKRE